MLGTFFSIFKIKFRSFWIVPFKLVFCQLIIILVSGCNVESVNPDPPGHSAISAPSPSGMHSMQIDLTGLVLDVESQRCSVLGGGVGVNRLFSRWLCTLLLKMSTAVNSSREEGFKNIDRYIKYMKH